MLIVINSTDPCEAYCIRVRSHIKLFVKSGLKYTCTLKNFEKVKQKKKKKWDFKKLYIKVKSWVYKLMPAP